jgi:23S rRNA (adenine2503-C2)-methyltransferase
MPLTSTSTSTLPSPPSSPSGCAVLSSAPRAPVLPKSLLGLTRTELESELVASGLKKYRALQVWQWVYRRGAKSFDHMTDLPVALREQLASKYGFAYGQVYADQTSVDGTRKWGLNYDRGAKIETVFIPEPDRGTLCFSSQFGCSLQCSFCHTGTMSKSTLRNLKVEEIVGQILHAKHAVGDYELMAQVCKFLIV